jgi:hypothetical protein
VAAAEIIALWKNGATESKTSAPELTKWLRSNKTSPPAELVGNARIAIERILREPSELIELWGEGGELTEWQSIVTGILERL